MPSLMKVSRLATTKTPMTPHSTLASTPTTSALRTKSRSSAAARSPMGVLARGEELHGAVDQDHPLDLCRHRADVVGHQHHRDPRVELLENAGEHLARLRVDRGGRIVEKSERSGPRPGAGAQP